MCGIIPAYAGNTCQCIRHWFSARDHPRVCGEHRISSYSYTCATGSSPRMRGTRKCRARVVFSDGIIPAYAGNTSSSCTYLPSYGDHPRVCGEHYISLRSDKIGAGSSPRMRGTHTDRLEACLGLGIIPAYAGNTTGKVAVNNKGRDHPRVCGEHWRIV